MNKFINTVKLIIPKKVRTYLMRTFREKQRVRYLSQCKKHLSTYLDTELTKYLLDKESYDCATALINRVAYNKETEMLKHNIKYGYKFTIPELDIFKGKKLLLPRGKHDEYYRLLLDNSEWKNSYQFVDSISSLSLLKDNEILILDDEMQIQIKSTQCYRSKFGTIVGTTGHQYMDIFPPVDNEIIVDAGGYDATTALEFANWTDNKYQKIYTFEPNQNDCALCEENIKKSGLKNIILIKKGTWSEETELYFSDNAISSGGRFQEADSAIRLPVTTIDNIVLDEKVTLIKMDIEGSELQALRGAQKTIKRNLPRLAICIYHKEQDLYEIPQYILSLSDKYRFYIRHYASNYWETVLYAITV